MPKISLMIHTASSDEFLRNHSIPSYFDAVTRCLCQQTFKEFEFIYIDTFYEDNIEKFQPIISSLPFVVKHVPIHKNHRYWYDLGHCYISAAKNTGILYADAPLLITCDDGEFFPENFLELYWNHAKMGNLMHALHKRMKSIIVENGIPKMPISGNFYINDHRFNHVQSGPYVHQNGSWMFAGTSFMMEDALMINGFNERMDGCKSLEDCDFGGRLAMLGRKFVADADGLLMILDHHGYSEIPTTIEDGQETPLPPIKRKKITNLIAVENYGMVKCATQLFDPIANKNPITKQHLEIIQAATLKYRFFDPLAEENKAKLDVWLKTPTFNLEAERAELRNSADWKW